MSTTMSTVFKAAQGFSRKASKLQSSQMGDAHLQDQVAE